MSLELERRIAQLEERVKELEDDRALRELLARYGYNADCCREDEYVALFTEDGAVDLTNSSTGDGSDKLYYKGPQQLGGFIRDPKGNMNPETYGKAMHVQGNNVVTHVDGDNAVVNSYSIVLYGDNKSVRIGSAGNNQWVFRRVNGSWRIRERRRRQIGGHEYVSNLDGTPR